LFADMMQPARPIRVHGDNIALDVRPRPALATASYWIPAKNLTVTSDRNPESLEIPTGEPITLDLRLRAEGLTAAQLPDIASLLRLPPGLNAYPDQPKLENTGQNGTVVGERDQSVALIADHAGDFDVPALQIQWWDTNTDQLRTAELPAFTIKALPVAGNSSSPGALTKQDASESRGEGSLQRPGDSPPAGARSWQWRWVSTAALAAILLGVAIRWSLLRRHASATSAPSLPALMPRRNESRARSAVLAACKLDDPRGVRRALLDWAQAKWPDSPPVGLRDITARLEDPEITARLLELDRACFAGEVWNGAELLKAFERVSGASTKKHGQSRPALAELYPQA